MIYTIIVQGAFFYDYQNVQHLVLFLADFIRRRNYRIVLLAQRQKALVQKDDFVCLFSIRAFTAFLKGVYPALFDG